MPSSVPNSDTNSQPQSDTAAGADHLDRVQSELQTVKQQALATQQTLKKLQTHEAVDPVSAMVGELPRLSSIDGLMVGLALGLTVALALLWWFVWHRPKARLMAMPSRSGRKTGAPSTFHSLPEFDDRPTTRSQALTPTPKSAPRTIVPGGDTVAEPIHAVELDIDLDQPASGHYGRPDSGVGFDSEAAAGEVMRVRKSLAEKREARAQILEREDATDTGPLPLPSVRAWLDSGISAAGALDTPPSTPDPALAADPWLQPGESLQGGAPVPSLGDDINDIEFSFSLPEETEDPEDAEVVNVFDAEPAIPADLEQQLMELELAVDADLKRESELQVLDEPPAMTPEPEPEPEPIDIIESVSASLPETAPAPAPEPVLELELAPTPKPEPEPESEPMLELMPEPTPELTPELVQGNDIHSVVEEHPVGQDYAVTLALAQESAELQLLPEARDLALEVLESDDESLRTAAQDLLERINHMELTVDPDTIPWDEAR